LAVEITFQSFGSSLLTLLFQKTSEIAITHRLATMFLRRVVLLLLPDILGGFSLFACCALYLGYFR